MMSLKTLICILIPIKDVHPVVNKCLRSVHRLNQNIKVLIVDDGSEIPVIETPSLQWVRQDKRFIILRHDVSQGPAAARNTGLAWCREKGIEVVILLDSDCTVEPDFVLSHLNWHATMPDVACVGGAIQGVGQGLWAKLDGFMSWFTSLPGAPPREVCGLVHIPTTNMSLKTEKLPVQREVFSEQLRTGEDVAFLKSLRIAKQRVVFRPQPVIAHFDRTTFRSFLRHQWRWALHTYAVRAGGLGSPALLRFALATMFFFLIPLFALFSTALNVRPWLRQSPRYIVYAPGVWAVYVIKGLGVFLGICQPSLALYSKSSQSVCTGSDRQEEVLLEDLRTFVDQEL